MAGLALVWIQNVLWRKQEHRAAPTTRPGQHRQEVEAGMEQEMRKPTILRDCFERPTLCSYQPLRSLRRTQDGGEHGFKRQNASLFSPLEKVPS